MWLSFTNLVVNKSMESKKNIFQTISLIIFWDFLMLYQIFLSPQAKSWAITIYKYGIYELPEKLPNDLRFRILGN